MLNAEEQVNTSSVVRIEVVTGDVFQHEADVLALKFAQHLYGVDLGVVDRLEALGRDIRSRLPGIGDHLLVASNGAVCASYVLFLGVQPLGRFAYAEIRQFARAVLHRLAEVKWEVRYVALTLHGRGFGLDEAEAFKAEIAGLLDALAAVDHPPSLEHIAIVERDARTADRLTAILDKLLPTQSVIPGRPRSGSAEEADARNVLRNVGDASSAKPHVFVAMPFTPELEDRFHYGIRGAVNAAGYLCERADLASFTGDVITWVRERIDNAALVVADLSMANPNVYLEVGYAWGRGVRTVLLASSASELRFDVRGQRCLVFKSIQHLEELLTKELVALGPKSPAAF